jgi:hypothetical protein
MLCQAFFLKIPVFHPFHLSYPHADEDAEDGMLPEFWSTLSERFLEYNCIVLVLVKESGPADPAGIFSAFFIGPCNLADIVIDQLNLADGHIVYVLARGQHPVL